MISRFRTVGALILAGCLLPGLAKASNQPPVAAAGSQTSVFAPLSKGWTASGGALTGDSPDYYSLASTDQGAFGDNSWTYYTVHPVDLWRNTLAGDAAWTDYRVDCNLTVQRPAPTHGFRGGETFFNYQWGREAVGSDAAVMVRYNGPDDYYAVRISTGFHHLELWKTHGGVVQVKPYNFVPGALYHLSIAASGDWLSVAVNGKKLLNYCDTVDPLLHGQVGIGVRESRTSFSGFTVTPIGGDARPAPSHRPNFRVRDWVGKKYIFDGDEPIGWFYWDDQWGMQLREMKLLPGLMPLVMPNLGIASDRFKREGDLKIGREGKTLEFTTSQMGINDSFQCTANWTLTYHAGSGYLWDKKVHFLALQAGAEPNIQIDDPYFYQMVAPQTNKLPKCRATPNYCIFDRNDGKLIAFPNAHHMWTDGLADAGKEIIRSGGYGVPTVDGWGVAVHIMDDNAHPYSMGFCHWGLDMHLTATDHPATAKGATYDGHMQFSLWDRDTVRAQLAKGVLPEPAKPNPAELFNNVEPVNHFQTLSPGLTGESVRLWTGKYTVDHTVGHNDSISMRIDSKDIVHRSDADWGDERPNIWLGSSYWTGPYLAPRYRFGMWVKADSYHGKVALIAAKFNFASGQKMDPIKVELPINGKCDWTYISFEGSFPRDVYNWTLRIDTEGDGVVWVDDVEVTPLAANLTAEAQRRGDRQEN